MLAKWEEGREVGDGRGDLAEQAPEGLDGGCDGADGEHDGDDDEDLDRPPAGRP